MQGMVARVARVARVVGPRVARVGCPRTLATLPRVTAVHLPRVQGGVLHPPYDVSVPDCTYPEFIWSGLEGVEDLVAMQCGITGRVLTHGHLRALALR